MSLLYFQFIIFFQMLPKNSPLFYYLILQIKKNAYHCFVYYLSLCIIIFLPPFLISFFVQQRISALGWENPGYDTHRKVFLYPQHGVGQRKPRYILDLNFKLFIMANTFFFSFSLKLPYQEQLALKQREFYRTLKELGKRLKQVKAPLCMEGHLPCPVENIQSSVS